MQKKMFAAFFVVLLLALPGAAATVSQASPASKPSQATAGKSSQAPAGSQAAAGDKAAQAGKPALLPSRPVTKAAPPPPGRWTDIGYFAVNGVYQGGGSAFSETFTFPQHVEQASITTRYPKKDGPAFGAGVAFRVWRNLAASVGVSSLSRSTTGEVSGSIPHPFHFRTDRLVAGTVALDRTETAVHLAAAYVIPAGRRMLVTLAAGPSYFSVRQSLVERVDFTEDYPYDEATLRPVSAPAVSATKVGFNAGLDVGYYFTRIVGLGLNVRYAAANLSVPSHGGSVAVKAGGFQAGAGLRLRIPKPAPKAKLVAKPAGAKPVTGTKPGVKGEPKPSAKAGDVKGN